MRIGVIGTGKIGATIGGLWVKAGHEVCFGSRTPDRLRSQMAELGTGASAASIEDAARLGEVVFSAAPYGIWPDLARAVEPWVGGKVLMDAANPYPERDGPFAQAAIEAARGAGMPVAALLPGVRLIRAFNSVFWETLRTEAYRDGQRLGIPLAGDDHAALLVAAGLVRDAGFDPVLAGPLVQAAAFDVGEPAYNNPMTAAELARVLGLDPPG